MHVSWNSKRFPQLFPENRNVQSRREQGGERERERERIKERIVEDREDGATSHVLTRGDYKSHEDNIPTQWTQPGISFD